MPVLVRGAACAALLALALPCAATAAERAARTWRPATSVEGARIVDAHRGPTVRAVPEPIATPPAQRAYIDPATNELVSAPAVPPEPEDDPVQRAQQAQMTLERNALGFYRLDTRDYQMRATATLDADGNVHKDCVDAEPRR